MGTNAEIRANPPTEAILQRETLPKRLDPQVGDVFQQGARLQAVAVKHGQILIKPEGVTVINRRQPGGRCRKY
jgi:hypothetical protein